VATKTKLKAKQERFCQEYIIDGNGKQAAIRAGYATKSATSIASELLTFPHVAARIAALQAKVENRRIMTAVETLEEISLVARTDMQDFVTVNEDGDVQIKAFADMKKGTTRCIQSVEVKKVRYRGPDGEPVDEVTTKLKLWSKDNALDAMGRHHKLFDRKESEDRPVAVNVTFRPAQRPEKGSD